MQVPDTEQERRRARIAGQPRLTVDLLQWVHVTLTSVLTLQQDCRRSCLCSSSALRRKQFLSTRIDTAVNRQKIALKGMQYASGATDGRPPSHRALRTPMRYRNDLTLAPSPRCISEHRLKIAASGNRLIFAMSPMTCISFSQTSTFIVAGKYF